VSKTSQQMLYAGKQNSKQNEPKESRRQTHSQKRHSYSLSRNQDEEQSIQEVSEDEGNKTNQQEGL
jgi:hypothetical protein